MSLANLHTRPLAYRNISINRKNIYRKKSRRRTNNNDYFMFLSKAFWFPHIRKFKLIYKYTKKNTNSFIQVYNTVKCNIVCSSLLGILLIFFFSCSYTYVYLAIFSLILLYKYLHINIFIVIHTTTTV